LFSDLKKGIMGSYDVVRSSLRKGVDEEEGERKDVGQKLAMVSDPSSLCEIWKGISICSNESAVPWKTLPAV
jgi:hypothetical protein